MTVSTPSKIKSERVSLLPPYKVLELAIKRTLDKSHQEHFGFLPDLFWYLCEKQKFKKFFNDGGCELPSCLEAIGILNFQTYLPEPPEIINIPKPDKGIRPGAIVSFRDKVIFQAIIDSFSKKIDEYLEDENTVFGYRIPDNLNYIRLFDKGINRWKDFQQYAINCYKEENYSYMLRTDIVGFFEHIKHHILLEQLEAAGVKDSSIKLLRAFLEQWTICKGTGIPQGLLGASILANIYLDPVDKSMKRDGYKYFRYMDDIFVFGNALTEVRKAKLLLTEETRKLGLSLQSKKTDIHKEKEIISFLEEKINEFEYIKFLQNTPGNEILTIDKVKHELDKFFAEKDKSPRHLKFLLWRLRSIKNKSKVKNHIFRLFRNISEYAYVTDIIYHTLRECIEWKAVRESIFNFLNSEDAIYDWQNIWLLKTVLYYEGELERKYIDFSRRQIKNNPSINRHLKAHYYLIIGKFGDQNDLDCITNFVHQEPDEMVKSALTLALLRQNKKKRDEIYGRLAQVDEKQKEIISLIKTNELSFKSIHN